MYTICTAGHVDHGKSTLVRALTHMEPDRLVEERARALTIDLGFAWTDVVVGDGAATVFFLDLPGHERFMTNMLAGAVSSGRVVLFVVAADEGWMPQSAEHLQVLDLLGISAGVVALTKADVVDEETLEVGRELVRAELAGTSLAEVPVLAVSAQDGAGLEALRRALVDAALSAADAPVSGRPRLWVDRSFSVAGAGTVVTGTLVGGSLHEGDEVVLQGTETLRGRVRGLEVMQRRVDLAGPGMRVAVNLAGVAWKQVRRGDVVCRPDEWSPTDSFVVWLRTCGDGDIGPRGAWQIHIGSGHWEASVRPIATVKSIAREGFARVRVDRPLTLAPGDRFILRDVGRRAVAGGGLIVDVDPQPLARGARGRADCLAALALRLAVIRSGGDVMEAHVAERGHASRTAAARAADVTPARAEEIAGQAGLVAVADSWVHPDRWAEWSSLVVDRIRAYHDAEPVERVAKPSVVFRVLEAAGCPARLAARVLDVLVAEGLLVAEFAGVRDPRHMPALEGELAAARDALLGTLRQTGLAPPRIAELLATTGASDALLRELINRGDVVRIDSDFVMLPDVIDDAVVALRHAFESEGPLSVSSAKDVLDITRRHAIPLLNHLDRTGRTTRDGDMRQVRP